MEKKVSSKIKKILWATDFSKESRFCLPYVKLFSEKLQTKNYALYVLPKFSDWIYETAFFNDEELHKTIEKTRQQSMEKMLNFSRKSDIPFQVDVVEGIESEEIINYSQANQVDMIFVGRRGISEIEHILIGSTTSRLTRKSDIPVLVIPGSKKDGKIEKILSPIDFTEFSLLELNYSISLAKQLQASLSVVHISEFFNIKVPVLKRDKLIEKINKKIEGIAATHNYKIDNIFYDIGEPAQKIIEIAKANQIDLITMATHQRKGIEKFFLGSISEKVLMYANIPALILPPSDYELS
ncbi:MAG: universal stress protein [Candidatus Aminicenantes bacterium]|nr:universal stress protein [Candidatus Aminicenantes bacterium]